MRGAASLVLVLVLAGCGSGTGTGSGTRAGTGASTGPGTSGASAAHWQTALAALGAGPMPAQPDFDAAGLARWNGFIAACWADIAWQVRPFVDQAVRSALPSIFSQFVLKSIKSLDLDLRAAPGFASGGPSRLLTMLPAPPEAWSMTAVLEIAATTSGTIAGIPFAAGVTLDVTVRADDVRLLEGLDFDLSSPARPVARSADRPQLSLRLSVSSASAIPLVQTLAGAITTALDPVIRAGLFAGGAYAQQKITGALQNLPQTPWGLGGPAIQPAAAPRDLGLAAGQVADEIARHHTPFGTLLTVDFDQPFYGNGNVKGYADYGDSAIWTGHYLAAEAIRYDVTGGDPRALAGAARVLDGLTACLDLAGQGSGLLARCVVPVASPFIMDISGWGACYYGEHEGVRMGGLGYISRDQYIGAVLGFTQAWLRVPALRAQAAENLSRALAYLEQNGWAASDYVSARTITPFGTSPDVLWAFVKAANMADRARWSYLHDANTDLASVLWFPIWMSSREVHDGYFKFNLMTSTMAILVATEADPALYRQYLKGAEITHDAVGHHQNAWFDVVYGIAVPSAAAAQGALVRSELELWTLRERRAVLKMNSLDPAIAKTIYTPVGQVTAQPKWVAVHPIPIERRVHGDFLWQTDPYQLDGGQTSPERQHAGVDLLLPYWVARSYGMLP